MDITSTLDRILADFPFPYTLTQRDARSVTGIAIDNRTVQPGNIFVALRGGRVDRHAFIPDAIARGAVAIVGEQPLENLSVPYIRVENSRHALTHLAAGFYDYPGKKLTVIGVTGTDGKTTTSNLLYHSLVAAGIKAGMISTVNAVIGHEILDTGFHVTTPDAPDVQRYLAKMVSAGLTHVVLETTSHGLAQHRTDAAFYDIGVLTNITHEHLDEHGSYENYRAAKGRLFQLLAGTPIKAQGNPRLAVLNRDDVKSYDYLHALTPTPQISYGLSSQADIYAENIRYEPAGIVFDAVGKDFRVEINSALVGAYNVSNCLAAFVVAVKGLGIAPAIAARGIANLAGVPGRMERLDLGQPFTAMVDFAHTPNALTVTLETARKMLATESTPSVVKKPRVIAVFGSAGLRDKEKRRMMAEVAAELADITVLTAEDPRTESLDGILAEMAAGSESHGGVEGQTFWRIPDRGAAIRFAVQLAQEGDIVLACGKGHEQSMCFGAREHLWDDRSAMRAALAELLGVDGTPMPYLPTQDTEEKEWLTWK